MMIPTDDDPPAVAPSFGTITVSGDEALIFHLILRHLLEAALVALSVLISNPRRISRLVPALLRQMETGSFQKIICLV